MFFSTPTDDAKPVSTPPTDDLHNHLVFKIEHQEYAIPVGHVRGLIGMPELTKIPAPDYVRGVIDVQGTAVPVLDLRVKLGLPTTTVTTQQVIVIVQASASDRDVAAGILVDEGLEVRAVDADEIVPAPLYGASSQPAAAKPAEHKPRPIYVLDVERICAEMRSSWRAQ